MKLREELNNAEIDYTDVANSDFTKFIPSEKAERIALQYSNEVWRSGGWVNPNSTIPTQYDSVVLCDGASIFIGHWELSPKYSTDTIKYDACDWYKDGCDTKINIKCWMPLPELPII